MEEEKMSQQEQAIFRMASQGMGKSEYDEDKAWEKVQERTCRKSWRPGKGFSLGYAAGVLLLLGLSWTAIWFYPGEQETESVAVIADSIRPGSSKAELILATGERIELSGLAEKANVVQPGALVEVDSVAGSLRYVNTGDAADSIVQYNTLKIPKGGEYSLTLADGTVVWLNAESSLKFPVRFTARLREVYLDGEAYFKVAHDANRPFRVYAGGDEISVLGTSFNVCAYSGERYWHTTLVVGVIAVEHAGKKVVLKPSVQFLLDKETDKAQLRKVETDLYTSWIDGKIYFKGYRFEDIVRKLERWYDFEMCYKDEEVKNMKFRGVINKYDSFDTVLKILEQTTDVSFDIKGNRVIARRTSPAKNDNNN